MNLEKIEEKHESLINEYLEIFNEWNDIDVIDADSGFKKEVMTARLLGIKDQLDIIGAGMQLYEIAEEIKRRKSGIILP